MACKSTSPDSKRNPIRDFPVKGGVSGIDSACAWVKSPVCVDTVMLMVSSIIIAWKTTDAPLTLHQHHCGTIWNWESFNLTMTLGRLCWLDSPLASASTWSILWQGSGITEFIHQPVWMVSPFARFSHQQIALLTPMSFLCGWTC